MFYSFRNQQPIPYNEIPDRIRLSNGVTRTNKNTFTEEELSDAGYQQVENPPVITNNNEKVIWAGTEWQIVSLTEEEIENLWRDIRKSRDGRLASIDWRFLRYQSQIRLGLTPTDNIERLDQYAQALRDITLQTDPFNIVWPQDPTV